MSTVYVGTNELMVGFFFKVVKLTKTFEPGKGCDILQTERLKLKFKRRLDIISGDSSQIQSGAH